MSSTTRPDMGRLRALTAVLVGRSMVVAPDMVPTASSTEICTRCEPPQAELAHVRTAVVLAHVVRGLTEDCRRAVGV
eukprot:3658883-Rhodomonas_salina.1